MIATTTATAAQTTNQLIETSLGTITFRGMHGKLVDEPRMEYINKILKIDCSLYDKIYQLDDGWAGAYLFLNWYNFRLVHCGSGVPIRSEENGVLDVAPVIHCFS